MTVQIIINILISGSIFLLIALSFSLICEVTRFFHFAHGKKTVAGGWALGTGKSQNMSLMLFKGNQ